MKNKKKTIEEIGSIIIISGIIYILMLITQKIFPFGDSSLMGGDVTGQYIPFFSYFKNAFSGTDAVIFSMAKMFGGNMWGIWTYYLLSPFNVLYLFFPLKYIVECFTIVTGLKLITTSVTMYFYIKRKTENPFLRIVISLCYAFCGYNIAFLINIMWLDSVLLLPLVCIGIEKLFEKKNQFYTIVLAVTFITNYYISFSICIYAVIYFFYLAILQGREKIKETGKTFLTFATRSIVAALIAMFVLLPTLDVLKQGKGESFDISIKDITSFNFNIADLGIKFLPGTIDNTEIWKGLPNIYIGLIGILLVQLYFSRKTVSKKEKIVDLCLLLLLIFNFENQLLNLIWSGLKVPAGYQYRYSFVFCFSLLMMVPKALKGIEKQEYKNIFYILGIDIFILFLLYQRGYESFTQEVMQISIILLIVNCLLIFGSFKRQQTVHILAILMLLCTSFEFIYNYQLAHEAIVPMPRNDYMTRVGNYQAAINQIKEIDTSFYRLEKTGEITLNDALLFNYYGMGHSSSTFDEKYCELMREIGYTYYSYWPSYGTGNTRLTDALFGIRYIVAETGKKHRDYEKIAGANGYDILKNDDALSLGIASQGLGNEVENNKENPFDLQTYYFNELANENLQYFEEIDSVQFEIENIRILEDNTIEKINQEEVGMITIQIPKLKEEVYLYIKADYAGIPCAFDVIVNDQNLGEYIGVSNNGILELKNMEENETNTLQLKLKVNEPISIEEFSIKKLNIQNYQKAINTIKSQESLANIEIKHNTIQSEITMKQAGYLMTTIPYDENFQVFVDGKKVQKQKAFDKLIGIFVEEGHHKIEFQYRYHLLEIGILVSGATILLMIVVSFRKKKQLKLCEKNK